MDNLYRIAIIDDDPKALVALKKVFDRPDMGFTVAFAEQSASSYITRFESDIPDVIIIDTHMPKLNCIDFIQYVRQLKYDMPVVIVSDYRDFNCAQAAIKFDVVEYCLKPVPQEKAEELLNELKHEIEERKLLAEYKKLHANDQHNIQNNGFKAMLDYIEQNYNKHLRLSELAPKFFINPNYCCTLFNRYKGTTFSQYLTALRLEKAEYFLEKTTLPIKQIASMVGFSDYFYFNKVFKKYKSITPFEYRKLKKGESAAANSDSPEQERK